MDGNVHYFLFVCRCVRIMRACESMCCVNFAPTGSSYNFTTNPSSKVNCSKRLYNMLTIFVCMLLTPVVSVLICFNKAHIQIITGPFCLRSLRTVQVWMSL